MDGEGWVAVADPVVDPETEETQGTEARAPSSPVPAPTLEELYRRDLRPLVALAFGLSGSRSAAEELVQEAFLAAHRRWDRISTYDDPSAWLRRVVLNRSVSGVRRRVAEARALARLGGRRVLPDALPERDEMVWGAVRSLPARQAQAVALYYVEDRTVADIARILDCAEGTVKAHLHKARQSLARALGATVSGADTSMATNGAGPSGGVHGSDEEDPR